jgi:molybdopterin/thiamine biosynthesis adenylyltransferase
VTPIAESAAISDRIRVRPSVSWVERQNGVVEFFFGNTRRQKEVRAVSPLLAALRQMNGQQNLAAIADLLSIPHAQLLDWASHLINWSVAERMEIVEWIESTPWRRSLQMFGDFIPDHELKAIWDRIGTTNFVLLGCGAVGSWAADGLARVGGKRFLLVDHDKVEASNLNRSLFVVADIGRKKTTALADRIRSVQPDAVLRESHRRIDATADLECLIEDDTQTVIISCIDYPNVDTAAGIVNRVCVERNIPLIVAGGYNLHLSLIGITVIPRKTACFQCSLSYLKRSTIPDQLPVKKLPRPFRNIGNIAPLAAITASIASIEAIRVAAKDDRLKPVMLNRRGEFSFFSESFAWVDIPRQEDCPVCGDNHEQ